MLKVRHFTVSFKIEVDLEAHMHKCVAAAHLKKLGCEQKKALKVSDTKQKQLEEHFDVN